MYQKSFSHHRNGFSRNGIRVHVFQRYRDGRSRRSVGGYRRWTGADCTCRSIRLNNSKGHGRSLSDGYGVGRISGCKDR